MGLRAAQRVLADGTRNVGRHFAAVIALIAGPTKLPCASGRFQQ
jgi:hypothetical protein